MSSRWMPHRNVQNHPWSLSSTYTLGSRPSNLSFRRTREATSYVRILLRTLDRGSGSQARSYSEKCSSVTSTAREPHGTLWFRDYVASLRSASPQGSLTHMVCHNFRGPSDRIVPMITVRRAFDRCFPLGTLAVMNHVTLRTVFWIIVLNKSKLLRGETWNYYFRDNPNTLSFATMLP